MNKLDIKADLFPFKFQKCFLRTLNFLLGIFIWFLSPIQIIWNVCSLPKFSPFSPFSQLYTEINNQFKENLPAIPHVNPSSFHAENSILLESWLVKKREKTSSDFLQLDWKTRVFVSGKSTWIYASVPSRSACGHWMGGTCAPSSERLWSYTQQLILANHMNPFARWYKRCVNCS